MGGFAGSLLTRVSLVSLRGCSAEDVGLGASGSHERPAGTCGPRESSTGAAGRTGRSR